MPAIKTIAKAALLVGTLDILAACTQFYLKTGKEPFTRILKFVASGLLGNAAYTNGNEMMWVGLLIHYCIATTFTIFFFLTIAKTQFVRKLPLLAGVLYGAFVWIVMNLLVLPLTNAAPLPKSFASVSQAMGILMICIGIPLAFIAAAQQRKVLH